MGQIPAFYWRWLKVAFSGAFDRTALIAFIAFAGIDTAKHFNPNVREMTETIVWAVPYWALAIVVGWRLLAAPFVIWTQDQTKLAALETQEERKSKRNALGELIHEATPLLAAFRADGELNHLISLQKDWADKALEVLQRKFDPSYISHFMSDAGIISGEPAGLAEDRLCRWRWLNNRVIRAQEILQSL